MTATVTWADMRFEAHSRGVRVIDLSSGGEYNNVLDCVCHTERGYIYGGSCRNYPWSSAVILATKVDDKIEIHAYPTEINPTGQLLVDCDELEALLELKPKVFLMKEPLFNPYNLSYQWETFLEGHPMYSKQDGFEVGQIISPNDAWEAKSRRVRMFINKSTGYIWTAEGFEKYRYLAEAKLEQLRAAPAADNWDDDEYDWIDNDRYEDYCGEEE